MGAKSVFPIFYRREIWFFPVKIVHFGRPRTTSKSDFPFHFQFSTSPISNFPSFPPHFPFLPCPLFPVGQQKFPGEKYQRGTLPPASLLLRHCPPQHDTHQHPYPTVPPNAHMLTTAYKHACKTSIHHAYQAHLKFAIFSDKTGYCSFAHRRISFLKGALDNFSLIPKFFSKKVEIFISLEVYTYVVTAC